MYQRFPKKKPYLLDAYAVGGITKSKVYAQKFIDFHYRLYSELAFQRSQIKEKIQEVLVRATREVELPRWQRAVTLRYSEDPLSTIGSVTGVGQRFNIGDIDPARFPVFPALYLAFDQETAYQEKVGVVSAECEMDAEDVALTGKTSLSIFSISGRLDSVLDVTNQKCLEEFVLLIKGFRLSKELRKMAHKMKIDGPRLVTDTNELCDKLLAMNWRLLPTQCDVPSNSQIMGQLVADAGIEGIIYKSKHTDKPCLAVFPQNFSNSASFLQLDDEAPSYITKKRIDARNYREFLPQA